MRKLAACLILGAFSAACSDKDRTGAPALPDCNDPSCGMPRGGGTQGGSTTTDSGAITDAAVDASAVDVTFTVGKLVPTDGTRFVETPYPGVVSVTADGLAGGRVGTPDAGSPSAGSLAAVASGINWFSVQGEPGGRTITPTLQPVLVSPATPALPLVALADLSDAPLFVDGVPWAPSSTSASLFLFFRRAGRAVEGVTVTGGADFVAYDSAGAFATVNTIGNVGTGAQGTVIIREIAASLPPPGVLATVRYKVASIERGLSARLAPGFVTWMVVDVP